MESIKKNLEIARADLIEAQKWLHFQRQHNCERDFPDIWKRTVANRRAAADRVRSLQNMASPSL